MQLPRRGAVSVLLVLILFFGAATLPTSGASAPRSTAPEPVHSVVAAIVTGETSAPRSAAPEPVHSAVVTVDGPSAYGVFARTVGDDVPAASVRALAGKLAESLRNADREATRAQDPVVRRAESLGVRVISRYTAAVNGLLVHGTAAQLAALAAAPGVVRIEDAPRVKPALSRSVPRVGAEDVTARLGFTGTGTIVAVVDTGIDYTHGSFGGPGSPDAYEAATRHAEAIDDMWMGERLFPNDIVVGGWDFVGPNYTHPDLCPPQAEAAGSCTSTPHPDPDPLDQHGHGTHVASAAGGRATEEVSRGVAPGTTFVALKVYGPPRNHADTDETIDVLIDAVEWCVRVNLGLGVPGVAPPAPGVVHVINMSLGEPYAQGSRLVDEAFAAASGAGMVLVTAGGNDGNEPFIVSAPGASPMALSVAAASLGDTDDADMMSGFSARGPSKNGALKPDVTAPGLVITARYGTGTGASSSSGTSLSAPHVAGAAALLFERDRAQGLGLTALDISAMLMNTARPMPAAAGSVPIVRQGAGRIDVSRAAHVPVVVRVGDIASLNLGARSLVAGLTVNREVAVHSLVTDTLRLKAAARFRTADDGDAGVALTVPEEPIVVPPGGSAAVPVSFTIDPSELREWSALGSTPPFPTDVVDRLEIDGTVSLTPVDAEGAPVDDLPAVRVPFYVLPRAASFVTVVTGSADDLLALRNDGDAPGAAEIYVVPDGGRSEDPDEALVVGELDVRRIGVRYDPDGRTLSFGVALHDIAVVPHLTQLELYLDVDLDGRTDYRVKAGGVSFDVGDTMVAIGAWDEDTGRLIAGERIVGDGAYDLHSRVFRIDVPLRDLGIGSGAPFEFYALHRALTEDWWSLVQVDAVPDGYDSPCGVTRLRIDPPSWTGLPNSWRVEVGGGGSVDVPRSSGAGSRVPALLVLFPDNRFEEADAMVAVVTAGADPEPVNVRGLCRAYLPVMLRKHKVRPLAPSDAIIADAFSATEAAHWVKLKWDITDTRDPAQDGFRDYRLRSPDGMAYVWTPRVGEVQIEYIRVGGEGFVRHVPFGAPGPWRCHPVDEHMLFLPDWLARLRSFAPEVGWQLVDESPYYGTNAYLLRHEAVDGSVAYTARVHVDTGEMLLLSRRETVGARLVRQEVFEFRDYGIVNVGMSRPAGLRCP